MTEAIAGIITAALGAVDSLIGAAGDASKGNSTTNIQSAATGDQTENQNVASGERLKADIKKEKSDYNKADIATAALGAVGNLMSAAGEASKGNGTINIQSAAQPAATGNQTGNQNVASDERLKNILKTEDPIDCFAKIDAYLYKYTPEARSMYPDESEGGGVNGDENFGVMAQDLAANPITAPAVEEDENGYLMLNGGRLSSINTAMISELCRKVQELEKAVYGRG